MSGHRVVVAPELTGRELDAAVAEKVMGWEWLERLNGGSKGTSRKAIFPPEDSDWVRVNFNADHWRPAQNGTERFSDWDDCCRSPDGDYGMPCYSTNIAAAMQVVERFPEWTIFKVDDSENSTASVEYHVEVTNDCRVFTCRAASVPEAICRAALAAEGQFIAR
jgi:hypothetical protein